MTVLSELVSGRLFYFDPLSATGGQSATLRELGLSFDGLDTTMIALDGNPYFNGRVDLRMGTDADGEIFLLSKSLGNIYRLTSLNAVPEPASWLMMIAGAGLIGGALRRRRVSGVVYLA
jgi:hypothetical protein